MDATIPDRGWYPRRGPLVHSYIEDRGKTCARNSLPLCVWEWVQARLKALSASCSLKADTAPDAFNPSCSQAG